MSVFFSVFFFFYANVKLKLYLPNLFFFYFLVKLLDAEAILRFKPKIDKFDKGQEINDLMPFDGNDQVKGQGQGQAKRVFDDQATLSIHHKGIL